MTDREVIMSYLPETEIRQQMAEEVAELYQALSKWRRAHNKVPGWQTSEADALKYVAEELGDVLLCAELLGIAPMKINAPDWVSAALEATSELFWAVHSMEPSATKQSMMLGKIVRWAEMQGVTNEQIKAGMDAKAARWRERLETDNEAD